MGRKVGSVPLTWRYVGKKEGHDTVTMDAPLRLFAKAIGLRHYSIRWKDENEKTITVSGWTITRQRWIKDYVLKQETDND
jgi:hypothetical protein